MNWQQVNRVSSVMTLLTPWRMMTAEQRAPGEWVCCFYNTEANQHAEATSWEGFAAFLRAVLPDAVLEARTEAAIGGDDDAPVSAAPVQLRCVQGPADRTIEEARLEEQFELGVFTFTCKSDYQGFVTWKVCLTRTPQLWELAPTIAAALGKLMLSNYTQVREALHWAKELAEGSKEPH